ncbi:MAG: S8 family serine peptidase, partial [Phycisphaerae bacterium]|nr:S8 family serine peptidase [Phycisphaerae bacterium]
MILVCSFMTAALPGRHALALDDAKEPAGSNYDAAHSAPYKATGLDIPIGIIETNAAINAAHNLGTRLKAQWDFDGKTPGNDPTDNSAATRDHTTLVANVAAGVHATRPGVATEAFIYTADINAPGTPANLAQRDGDNAIHNASFNSFRAAVDWMYTPIGANPTLWKNHPRIALFNNSWGAGYEQDDNGTNRFALFVDHYSTTRDVLFVGAAGNYADDA